MNINQQGFNDNQVNDKNVLQIKIMKNSKNDNLKPRDIKMPKTNVSGIGKMEDK